MAGGGWQQRLASQWDHELARAATLQHDDSPDARRYRRQVGLVVWGLGDVCVFATIGCLHWVGRVPRVLLGLDIVLWVVGLVMFFTGRNPLARLAKRTGAATSPPPAPRAAGLPPPPDAPGGHAMLSVEDGELPTGAPAVPPPLAPLPIATLPNSAPGDDELVLPRTDCDECRRVVEWDGVLEPASPLPLLVYRCGCGNRFGVVDTVTVDKLRTDLLSHRLRWRNATDRAEHRWVTRVGDAVLDLGVGDFPAEPLYQLRAGDVVLLSVDDWPQPWQQLESEPPPVGSPEGAGATVDGVA